MLPYFKYCGRQQSGAVGLARRKRTADRGRIGRSQSAFCAFVEAALNVGIWHNDDYNGRDPGGVSLIQVNIRKGRRHSAADAHPRPVLGRRI